MHSHLVLDIHVWRTGLALVHSRDGGYLVHIFNPHVLLLERYRHIIDGRFGFRICIFSSIEPADQSVTGGILLFFVDKLEIEFSFLLSLSLLFLLFF